MAPANRILLVVVAAGTLACPEFPAQQTIADCGPNGCSTGTSAGTSSDGLITVPTTAGGEAVTGSDLPMTIGPEITTGSPAAPDLPPFDAPPWIADLAVKPDAATEIGPSIITYTVSDDAIQAELFDDGQLVATRAAGEPFIFPVSSAPHNNPGSLLRVVVHDAADQTAYAELYQPSMVKAPGSEVWTTIEPAGQSSGGGGVALHGDDVVSAGFQVSPEQARMTVRRYDQAGKWTASEHGWSREHPDWTGIPILGGSSITGSGVAVDPAGNIVAIGNVADGPDTRMYLARFDALGGFDWELLGEPGTEARGVGVTADGTAYVAGAIRTAKGLDRWDLAVWVYGPDKVAHGVDVYADPEDKQQQRSERGRTVAVLDSGRVVVAGTREVLVQGWAGPLTRGVMLLYEGKGKRVGVWSSPGEVRGIDAVLAAVGTFDGVALCGYAIDPADPQQKPQILLRWLREDLSEVRKPHLEATLGAARCTALGYTVERKLVVGANVQDGDASDNIWIYAVGDPPITYLKYSGPADSADRIFALDCDYMCAFTGYQGDPLGGQWMTALLRG